MKLNFLNILIVILSISIIKTLTEITIFAKSEFNFKCENNFLIFSMDVFFSPKLSKTISFNIDSENNIPLFLKCIISHIKNKIICTTIIPNLSIYYSSQLKIRFPYRLPEIEDIIWDYNSFYNSRKGTFNTLNCKNLYETNLDNEHWDGIFKIILLENKNCETIYKNKKIENYYYFNMKLSVEEGEIINLLKDKNYEIELLQDLFVPLYNKNEHNYNYNYYLKFAYCNSNETINKNNYNNFIFECKIKTDLYDKFNDTIKIGTFFDKIYSKIIDEKNQTIEENKLFNLLFNPNIQFKNETEENTKYYIELSKYGNNIICPDKPIFIIDDKNQGISLEYFYKRNQKFLFILNGTLTNGFKYENNSIIYLTETKEEKTYKLFLTDNLAEQIDDNEIKVECILSTNTLYEEKNNAIIKCLGTKKNMTILNGYNNFLDITLNYNNKKNNNFEQFIIIWPYSLYDSKKNIYSYEMTGISMKQKDYFCDGDNFVFFIYIYDLEIEPKIKFDFPLEYPKNLKTTCILFDSETLRCSINLKHNFLFTGQHILLPPPGTKLEIYNEEGNKNVFIMNNFTNIKNIRDSNIFIHRFCGNFITIGILKDMGLSKKKSLGVTIGGIIFSIFILGFSIFFVIFMIKEKIKRGKLLLSNEEGSSSSSIKAHSKGMSSNLQKLN